MADAETKEADAGLAAVDRLLKAGALVHRWDAAAEILRILAQRETEYPRLIAEKRLAQAEADRRNGRLACAFTYVVEMNIGLTGPHRYRTDLERALWIAEERGFLVTPKPKGGRK